MPTVSEENIMPSQADLETLQQQFLDLAIEVLVKREPTLSFAADWISPHIKHELSGIVTGCRSIIKIHS